MQIRRLISREGSRFFDDTATAKAWLLGHRRASGAA